MSASAISERATDFISSVRLLVTDRARNSLSFGGNGDANVMMLTGGKMLRTRLAARLLAEQPAVSDVASLHEACAAMELVHAASLCHDDVLDNAQIRRGQPALWRAHGAPAAILIGDMLLCEAVQLAMEAGQQHLRRCIEKVSEVVEAEAEQELLWRGREQDEETYLRLARRKTGPLFAFAAGICAGDDASFLAAVEEAGYCIGTTYQLADDLLDVVGSETVTGKTLGTDRLRRKHTLARADSDGWDLTRGHIQRLCTLAIAQVADRPEAKRGLMQFIQEDLMPVLNRSLGNCLDLPA